MNMDFADRLVEARKAKGLSQETLAESLGVSRQAVSKWETGEAKPDLDNLMALCSQLDLSIEHLCFGEKTLQSTEKPKGRSVGIYWVFGIAVLCLLIGFTIGFVFQNAGRASQPGEAEPDYNALMAQIYTVNAKVRLEVEKNRLEISIMPSSMPEGLQVELLVENTALNEKTTVPCTLDGYYYVAYLDDLIHNINYQITAVYYWGDAQKQTPVFRDLHYDGVCYSYIPLLEEQ